MTTINVAQLAAALGVDEDEAIARVARIIAGRLGARLPVERLAAALGISEATAVLWMIGIPPHPWGDLPPTRCGQTALQIARAPQKSVFVWLNDRIDYPDGLARYLGRDDLHVLSARDAFAFNGKRLRGAQYVTVDHACVLTDSEWSLAVHAGRNANGR